MAAAQVKAPQTAAFTSTDDIVVAAGSVVTVGIYTDEAGGIASTECVKFYVNTPSVDNHDFTLRGGLGNQQKAIVGPCTLYGVKLATTRKIGVYKDEG